MDNPSKTEIARIVKAVIRELEPAQESESGQAHAPATQRKPSRQGPNVLAVFHAGVAHLEAALEQMQQIDAKTGRLGVYTVGAARGFVCGSDVREGAGVKCILDTVRPDGLEKVLERADVLVLPTFCFQTAARLASLICDDEGSQIVLSALMQGKPVLATNDGFLLRAKLVNPQLIKEVDRILDRVAGFGITFCTTERLSETFEILTAKPAAATSADITNEADTTTEKEAPPTALKLITAKAVRRARDERQSEVHVAAGGIVTPLARDLAKELGITVNMAPSS